MLTGAGRSEKLWGSGELIVASPRPFALKNLFELGISWEATGRKVAVSKQKSKLAFNLFLLIGADKNTRVLWAVSRLWGAQGFEFSMQT